MGLWLSSSSVIFLLLHQAAGEFGSASWNTPSLWLYWKRSSDCAKKTNNAQKTHYTQAYSSAILFLDSFLCIVWGKSYNQICNVTNLKEFKVYFGWKCRDIRRRQVQLQTFVHVKTRNFDAFLRTCWTAHGNGHGVLAKYQRADLKLLCSFRYTYRIIGIKWHTSGRVFLWFFKDCKRSYRHVAWKAASR